MKRKLILLLTLFSIITANSQIAVHDPAQTAATIAEMQKQLEEWAKNHESMQSLIKLNNQISEYSKKLNDYVGDAKKAAAKINEAKSILKRLKGLTKIEAIEILEKEIGDLEDITNVKGIINDKKEIYGEIKDEVNGVTIKRDAQDYKRYAMTTARMQKYDEERKQVVETIEMVQSELKIALEEARAATNQTEQIAVLTKIEALQTQLGLANLRFYTRTADVQTQVMANKDRRLMEEKNEDDAYRSKLDADRKIDQEEIKLYEELLKERKKNK